MVEIKEIKTIDSALKNDLVNLLVESVESGDLGFAHPLSNETANQYWSKIGCDLQNSNELSRRLFVAYVDNQVAGTIQIAFNPKYYTNCSHRAEVQKLMVSKSSRGKGVARKLLESIELAANQNDIKLLILDTRSDLTVPELYKKLGYIAVGDIPFYSLENNIYTSTTYFYKILDNNLLNNQRITQA